MFVSIYYKPSLFNAHTMILIVHIFMKVNKLCLNQEFNGFARKAENSADIVAIVKRLELISK